MRFNKNKWLSWGFFLLVSFIILFIGVFNNTLFSNYSNLILILVTIFYAFSAYELLRVTRERRSLAYVSVNFIVVGKVDAGFLKKYKALFRDEKELAVLKAGSNKDIVFIKAKNVGQAHAMDIKLKVVSDKKDGLTPEQETNTELKLGEIEPGQEIIDVLYTCSAPKQNDFLKIKKVKVEYIDVNSKVVGEDSTKKDLTDDVNLEFKGVDVVIDFQLPK